MVTSLNEHRGSSITISDNIAPLFINRNKSTLLKTDWCHLLQFLNDFEFNTDNILFRDKLKQTNLLSAIQLLKMLDAIEHNLTMQEQLRQQTWEILGYSRAMSKAEISRLDVTEKVTLARAIHCLKMQQRSYKQLEIDLPTQLQILKDDIGTIINYNNIHGVAAKNKSSLTAFENNL